MNLLKAIATALARSAARLAIGAAMICAPIFADLAFDLALLEGGTSRGGDETHILVVIAAAAVTIVGMIICLWAAWQAAWSLVMIARGRR